MRKILACAGVNGDEEALGRLLKVVDRRRPDLILFAGGIAPPEPHAPAKATFMTKFFRALGESDRLAAVIPGPQDTPLRDFLRLAQNAEVVFPRVFTVHATPYSKGDVAVGGIGGLLTESEDIYDSVTRYSHASAEYFLRTLWQIDKPIKILLLSEAPPGRLGGDTGNHLVQEFVKSFHPSFCIVAGESERRGWDEIGTTLIVNPGRVADGSAAWFERVTRRVEMVDL